MLKCFSHSFLKNSIEFFALIFQNLDSLSSYLKQFKKEEFLEMISNFHLLLYLITNDSIHFKIVRISHLIAFSFLSFFYWKRFVFFKDELEPLLDAVKRKDKDKAQKWSETNSQWATLGHLINEKGKN